MSLTKLDVTALFKSLGANIPEQVDPEQQNNEQRKELKKLLDSYMAVAEHMFGRPPTTEEMIGLLAEANKKPEENPADVPPLPTNEVKPATISLQQSQTPLSKAGDDVLPQKMSIMSSKVYYGRGKNQQPDPKSVLYYEQPDGSVYNASDSKWEDNRPAVLDHLDSRPILHNESDINNYMLHGLMDDNEFQSLSHMLPTGCHKMWALKKKIEDTQNLLDEENMGSAETHGKVIEMEHDLRELLDAVKYLQDRQEAMLAVLGEHGLDGQFVESQDVDISPEMQMEHEMNRRGVNEPPVSADQPIETSEVVGEPEEGLGKSEDLEKGQNGDWQKEGYKISTHPSSDYNPKWGGSLLIQAHDPKGGLVGQTEINSDEDTGDYYPMDIKVHQDHQRKGIAGAMYSHAEKILGLPLTRKPEDQSDAAKKLWSQPNRPFGNK